MKADQVKKYNKKSLPQLLKIAERKFNAFIRDRDRFTCCVSCGSLNTSDASHFYSAGHHPSLKFNENNVHLSCSKCNRFLHGNLNEYRRRITQRITQAELEELDNIADYWKRNSFKWDRMMVIDIILKYK